jgi:hypothetical protein
VSRNAFCPACREELPPAPGATSLPDQNKDRPWAPSQIGVAAFLFGPLAGGVLAAINSVRLGRPRLALPFVLVGAALFALALALVTLTPVELEPLARLAIPVGGALVFMEAQRPTFTRWKLANWAPTAQPGESYRPNQTRLLFTVGLACLVLQALVLLVLLDATGALV